jgi:GTP-binding protein
LDRLKKEADSNVGIIINIIQEKCEVCGRGELQISILAEQMRREGFEFSITKPKVILKKIDEEMKNMPEFYINTSKNKEGEDKKLNAGTQNSPEPKSDLVK